MTYLTDVSSDSPAFKVIPQTHTFVPEQGDLRGDDRGFAQLSPSGQVVPECCRDICCAWGPAQQMFVVGRRR